MTENEQMGGRQTRTKMKRPSMYNVVMHNDDETTMEFVVMVLVTVFRHSEEDAEALMLTVHIEGKAIVGTYCHYIASTKANHVMILARKNGFPLLLTVEEA